MDERRRWTNSTTVLVRAAAALATGLVAALLAAWRLGAVTRGTAWAEDAGLFLRERLALGPVDSLLHPYAGYLHLVPRLLVDLAWAVPVQWYAVAISLGACAVVGGIAAAVVVLARDVVPWWPARVVLALVPALLPLAPYEISGNAANLHWFLLFLAPWLFAYRARSWWGAGAQAVLTALVVLSEVQTVLFLPLLALAWTGQDRGRGRLRALPVSVVAVVGCAAQVVTALTTERDSRPAEPAFPDVVAGWLLQPVSALWRPDVANVVRAVVVHGWAVVLVPVALLLVLLVAGVLVAPWRTRWVLVALTAVSFGVWWAALLVNGIGDLPWAEARQALAALPPFRYAAASGMLLLAAAVVAAGALVERGRRSTTERGRRSTADRGGRRVLLTVTRIAGWGLLGAVLVATLGNAPQSVTRRSHGPVWADQVPAARATCERDPDGTVVVRAAPWNADVPCRRLVGR